MDTHIANDPNNPINWNGSNSKCTCCNVELDWKFDYENICNECFNTELTECCEAQFIGNTEKCSKCNENATVI